MASAHVVPNGTSWPLKVSGLVVSTHNNQSDAVSAGRTYLRSHGGGELSVHGTDGAVRAKGSVPPGNDPRNIRG